MDPLELEYRKYFPMLSAKCRRMLEDHDEATDIAQETFIRYWQNQKRITSDERVITAWLYRTATRLSLDRFRRRTVRERLLPPDEIPVEPDDVLAHRQQLRQLAGALSEDELELAILSRIDRLTQIELAEALDCSERTVRRALTRLETRLGELA